MLIGRDQQTDLALLKIERDEPFPFVEWANSDEVRVGDWMVAIGNPFGLGGTVTAGIVSARGRDIRAGPYDDFIQIDAAINRGNSGGPTFNLDGEVIGVNTAIFSPSGGNVGIGFAIPSNLAKRVIDSLKSGWPGRARLARRAHPRRHRRDRREPGPRRGRRGALVASVTPTGPAEDAGIQAGDVILQFNGQEITQMRSLPRIVAETDVGREVDVLIWRRGDEQTVRVTLGELPDEAALAQMGDTQVGHSTALLIEWLGLTVSALTTRCAPASAWPRVQRRGDHRCRAVHRGRRRRGALAGDLIVEVSQSEVGSPPEVMAKVNEVRDEGRTRSSCSSTGRATSASSRAG